MPLYKSSFCNVYPFLNFLKEISEIILESERVLRDLTKDKFDSFPNFVQVISDRVFEWGTVLSEENNLIIITL